MMLLSMVNMLYNQIDCDGLVALEIAYCTISLECVCMLFCIIVVHDFFELPIVM